MDSPALTHPQLAAAVPPIDVAAQRQAALPGFLARRLLAIDWLDGVPDAWTLRRVLETCKAELVWAAAERRRIDPAWPGFRHPHAEDFADYGHHLPHERAAATALAIHGHLLGHKYRLRECVLRLRAQRTAGWHQHALGSIDDIRGHWANRRTSWAAMVGAIAEYGRRRAAIDRPTSPAACRRAA